MNRLDEYGYAGLYKALKHKYKYALSTNLPCVSRHSQFLALLCIFPELISLQESCGSRFRLISRLFGCLKCLLLLISELYIYGRLTSVNCVIKKCNTKWRKLKAFLGVIFSPLTCAVKYFCKFLFGFLWRKVFRNGFFPF